MTTSFQIQKFAKETTGTNGVTQDVSLNFTPKAIRVYTVGLTTSSDDTVSANNFKSVGISDGTSHACIAGFSLDNAATSDSSSIHRNDAVISILTSTTVEAVRGTVAFGSNKVTFTWTVNNTTAYSIWIEAYGGDDITNAKVNTVNVNTTVTGNINYTGVGFTVDGDQKGCLLTLDAVLTTNNSITAHFYISVGHATSSTKQRSLGWGSEDGRNAADTRRSRTTNILTALDPSVGTIEHLANFVSWISDGFTLNYTNAPSSSTLKFSYLVIKGGFWDIGEQTIPATAVQSNYTVDVQSSPIRGLVTFSLNNGTSSTTNVVGSRNGIGASDGTNEMLLSIRDTDAADPSVSKRYQSSSSSAQCTGFINSTVDGITDDGDFNSFGTNQFTIDWVSVFGTSELINYMVVADTPPAVEAEQVYQSYGNIHENFDSNQKNAIFG